MTYACIDCGEPADGSEIDGEPACSECVETRRSRGVFGNAGGQR